MRFRYQVPRRVRRALAAIAAGPLFALAACGDVTRPADPSRASLAAPIAVNLSPDLLVVVADADARLVPALDADARAPMHVALTELRAALAGGDLARSQRAVAVVRALVSGHQSEHASRNSVGVRGGDSQQLAGTDGADLSSLALLADAVDAGLRSHQ